MNSFWIIHLVLGAVNVLIYLMCIKDEDIKLSELYKMFFMFILGIVGFLGIVLIFAMEYSDTVIYRRNK